MAGLADVKNEAMKLSPHDRLALVTFLWDSLAEGDLHFDHRETAQEALRRNDELEHGLSPEITHEEVMAEAREAVNVARISQNG